jgi:hypothetical protein
MLLFDQLASNDQDAILIACIVDRDDRRWQAEDKESSRDPVRLTEIVQ